MNRILIFKGRFLRVYRQEGLTSAIKKTINYCVNRRNKIPDYYAWRKKHIPSNGQLAEQAKSEFPYMPKISVVVPTYNTPKHFLTEMIESVVSQSYQNWELCIADGASTNENTLKILKEYQEKDQRIKVEFLEENLMISGNTNIALSLATGDYIGLFDHDDLLTKDALYEIAKAINKNNNPDLLYTDEDKVDENNAIFFGHHFKPDWSPDTLRGGNYICHFFVFKAEMLDKVGGFRSEFDGSQDHDLIFRMTEVANHIVHIPKVLYHWRVHQNSVAAIPETKLYAYEAGLNAVRSHLERVGMEADVEHGAKLGLFRIRYKIKNNPKVSIVIPNKDGKECLQLCIDSIFEKSTYSNYEIIVVENNSTTAEVFDYYTEIEKMGVKVVSWEGGYFNYSAINNYGAKFATGEQLILLNNDVEIITPNWIEEMLMYSQREDVGIVGAMLYYPDDTIQHAGVILGLGGVAGHSHKNYARGDHGYVMWLDNVRNVSAVTAACLMVKKEVFDEVEGLDELFEVAFNDVDFCLKVRKLNKLIVWTPFAELYHHESKSRGTEDTAEKIARFNREVNRMQSKWKNSLKDPYYNQNLTLSREDFTLGF